MPFTPGEDDQPRESVAYDSTPLFDPYSGDTTPGPAPVPPTSVRPDPPTQAVGGTSGSDGQLPPAADQPEEQAAPLPEFDPKYREPFTGLLYLGRLQKTFTQWGHTFVIRTATTEQLAEIGLVTRQYVGTLAESAVYESAIVAAAVVSVDGKPIPSGIMVDGTDEMEVRFRYVMQHWLPAVREAIYSEAYSLEMEARAVLEAVGKASG